MINSNNTTTNIFPNLLAAIKAEREKQTATFTSELNELQSVSDILNVWNYREMLPAGKKSYSWENVEQLKKYIIDRKAKTDAKYISEQEKHLCEVSAAPADIKEITITVEWKNNRTWGANPNATAEVRTTTPDTSGTSYNRYTSGSIGGCGYDKNSTAVAKALNQSPALLRALYAIRENELNKKLHDILGYGSGYFILPRFEGGVGVSCYPAIFEKIGLQWQHISGGKMFDVYKVARP